MDPIWYQSYPREVRQDLYIDPDMTLDRMISEACRSFKHKTVLSCMGVDVTFAQFERIATSFASYLQNKIGLKRGERVAILLPNIIQFPICFYGILKAGGTCTTINPYYTSSEMSLQIEDSRPSVLVCLDLFLDKVDEVLEKVPIDNVIVTSVADQLPTLRGLIYKGFAKKRSHKFRSSSISFKVALRQGAHVKLREPSHEAADIALLQYTGGTTGKSKGAMLSHQNLVANIMQIQEWSHTAGLESDETVLTALPLYHIFALTVNFLSFLTLGGRMILVPKATPIANTIKAFENYPVTVMTGVNTLYNALSHSEEFTNLNHILKIALAGGTSLQPDVNQRFQSIAGVRIYEGYGLTETSPVTHCCPVNGPDVDFSCGLPLPMTEIRLVDDNGQEVEVGEVGEIQVRGPQVMRGYWNDEEETNLVLNDGWLKTGDMAKVDKAGYFYIVDRKKDTILVSGYSVFPSEVEKVLCSHPGVMEACVVGYKDRDGAERVRAYVVRKKAMLTESELRSLCETKLAYYKHPKSYIFKESLPKSDVGKVLKRELGSGPA